MHSRDLRTGHELRPSWRLVAGVCLVMVLAFSLSSCQTITRITCNSKNWTKVGHQDGTAGQVAEDAFLAHDQKCSASGADIDKPTYMAGYQQGLLGFCTRDNGVAQAEQGYANQDVCEASMGPAFDEGFAQGLATLCDAAGGRYFGANGGIYRGTCPSATEQAFLTNYLDSMALALPQAMSDITILEIKAGALESDIDALELEVDAYGASIKSLLKIDESTPTEHLENERRNLESKLSDLGTEQIQTKDELKQARKKSETMQDMLIQWNQ